MPSRVAIDLYNVTHKLLRLLRNGRSQTTLTRERVSALLTLNEAGRASIKELAESEHVAHSTMSRLVSGLTARGLASASGDRVDKRANSVKLTARGRKVAERDLRKITEPLAEAIAGLPQRDAATLMRAVKVLNNVLSSVSTNHNK